MSRVRGQVGAGLTVLTAALALAAPALLRADPPAVTETTATDVTTTVAVTTTEPATTTETTTPEPTGATPAIAPAPQSGCPPAGALVFVPSARIEIPAPAAQTTEPAPAPTTTEPTSTTAAGTTPPASHDEGFGRPASKRVHFHPRKLRHLPLTVTPPLRAGPYT